MVLLVIKEPQNDNDGHWTDLNRMHWMKKNVALVINKIHKNYTKTT
jgi:hypothetical protein